MSLNMRPRILFFSYHQFGLLVDTVKYCEHLRGTYNITYLGWDYGKPKLELEGVAVKYVSRSGSLFRRNVNLLKALNHEVETGKYDIVFLHYTRGVSIVRLLHPKQRMIFDVRTLSVDPNRLKRKTYNTVLKVEGGLFRNRSVISEGVGTQIGFKNYHLLPLGADPILTAPVAGQTDRLRLLYVGTLLNRDVIKCVQGLKHYIEMTGDSNVELTIVGDSSGNERQDILDYVDRHPSLAGKVTCPGRVPHQQLGRYFLNADIGVSFIPMTRWYNFQPPTKTFEYLLSGIPVIATKTYENVNLLKFEHMSALIEDNSADFSRGISELKIKLPHLNAQALKERYEGYSWQNIVDRYFSKMIDSVII
ncbi:MAG: glycosyltransferase [Chitinophagaceae bacterium]|nr:MAG: glycosyltransferase [Chitinophagaceae bacterium]